MKQIITRRNPDFTPVVRRKLCGDFRGNKATRYGQKHEVVALQAYVQRKQQVSTGYSCANSGLVVCTTEPWLAASPDAFADDPVHGKGIVEVKCPYSCRDMPLKSACEKRSFCLQVDDTGHDLSLKRQHAYFYQIQLQLYVTECTWCDLVVWTPQEVFVQRIAKEEGFVEGHLPKLKKFYFDHLLPALFAESL